MKDATERVNALVSLKNYQQERVHVFPSEASVNWFIRRHRQALNEAEALVRIAGALLAVPDRFDAVVLSIGQAAVVRTSHAAQEPE